MAFYTVQVTCGNATVTEHAERGAFLGALKAATTKAMEIALANWEPSQEIPAVRYTCNGLGPWPVPEYIVLKNL